jgi:hypothetical protein
VSRPPDVQGVKTLAEKRERRKSMRGKVVMKKWENCGNADTRIGGWEEGALKSYDWEEFEKHSNNGLWLDFLCALNFL